MLALPAPDLRALVSGEVVVAFVERGAASEGDEVALTNCGGLPPEQLKPAYRRWHAAETPPGVWTAVVEAVHPAAIIDSGPGSARHVRMSVPDGDVVILRVFDAGEPVLSDEAHAARHRSVEGALR